MARVLTDNAESAACRGSCNGERCGHPFPQTSTFACVCLHRQLYLIGPDDRKKLSFAYVCRRRPARQVSREGSGGKRGR